VVHFLIQENRKN